MHSDHVPRTQSTGLHRWRDIANVLQVQFDFDAPQPEDFVGSIVDHDLGPVRLYEIEATAHVARRNTTGCVHGELPFTLRFPGPMREHVMSIPAQLLGHEMIASRHLAAISIPCREGIGRIARELLASTLTSVAELSTSERERVAHSLIDVFNTLAGSVLATAGKDLMDNGAYQVERITQYMYENLRDPTLSARNIAEALGISRRYMNKLFQREGTTVGRALLARRLEGSYRDLSDPYKRSRSVTEIAYAWGFNSPSHFSRAFRQRFGMSPREARGGG